jgi:hypothetical protein
MKKIAFFILFVFTLVQAVPAIQSLFNVNNGIVFNIDEEKGDEKNEPNEKKEKKYNSIYSLFVKAISAKAKITIHLAEKIYLSPCLEKLTPPPNFC